MLICDMQQKHCLEDFEWHQSTPFWIQQGYLKSSTLLSLLWKKHPHPKSLWNPNGRNPANQLISLELSHNFQRFLSLASTLSPQVFNTCWHPSISSISLQSPRVIPSYHHAIKQCGDEQNIQVLYTVIMRENGPLENCNDFPGHFFSQGVHSCYTATSRSSGNFSSSTSSHLFIPFLTWAENNNNNNNNNNNHNNDDDDDDDDDNDNNNNNNKEGPGGGTTDPW